MSRLIRGSLDSLISVAGGLECDSIVHGTNTVNRFTMLWANSADDNLMIFFLFFPENRI